MLSSPSSPFSSGEARRCSSAIATSPTCTSSKSDMPAIAVASSMSVGSFSCWVVSADVSEGAVACSSTSSTLEVGVSVMSN